MSDFAILLKARARMVRNSIAALRGESKLKTGFIAVFVAAFWLGLFEVFREAFHFISQAPTFETLLATLVFSLFFLTLLVMLVFSNAILFYTSLYRSRETDFLMSLPVREQSLFLYKFVETLFYSSWAFIYLGVPIIVAFGFHWGVPWYFYPAALVMFVIFVGIPAAVGSLISLLLVQFVPRSRFKVFLLFATGAFLVGVVVALRHFSGAAHPAFFRAGDIARLTNKLAFSQNPWLPSLWLTKGILSLSRSRPGWAFFYLLVILSNSLFLTSVAAVTSARLFWRSFSKSHSSAARRLRARRDLLRHGVERVFFFLPREIRLFLVKDTRTFLRDASQWSQVLIFFGVLGVYVANIRSLPYNLGIEEARGGIALLNLAATALVLSTFTGRFIFPLISLEGKKFWVLGLAPVERRRILYGKYFFAFFGSLAVSEALIIFSDWMLAFPASVMLGHAVMVLAICSGLAAVSVGLGACYPNLKEDNPARIVAGFGGTLNLIVSMLYILLMVAGVAMPFQLFATRHGAAGWAYWRIFGAYVAISLSLGTLVTVTFLGLGRSRFEKLEF